MAYLDNFRALASIAVNNEIDETLKTKAKGIMSKIMDIIDKESDIEKKQVEAFYTKTILGIETVE